MRPKLSLQRARAASAVLKQSHAGLPPGFDDDMALEKMHRSINTWIVAPFITPVVLFIGSALWYLVAFVAIAFVALFIVGQSGASHYWLFVAFGLGLLLNSLVFYFAVEP